MSSIHVMTGTGKAYTVFVHVAVPAGNNAAGIPWATVLANSGKNVTAMVIGTGPGQITSAEAGEITAGTVIEGSFIWEDQPQQNNAWRIADLDQRAIQLKNELLARTQNELQYFGFTRA